MRRYAARPTDCRRPNRGPTAAEYPGRRREAVQRFARAPELTAGNKSVRSSLDASFHLLTSPAQRALVGLAGIASSTFAAWMLAPMLDIALEHAEEIVGELVGTHLLEPAAPGPDAVSRYRFHDLVRAYCRDAGHHFDPTGYHRLIEWSIALSAFAQQGIKPRPVRYAIVEETSADLGSHIMERIVTEPLSWVAAESSTLLTVLDLAAQLDLPRAAAALLVSLRVSLVRLDLLDHCASAAVRLNRLVNADPTTRVCAALADATAAFHRAQYNDAVHTLTGVRPLLPDVEAALRADVLGKLGDASERCRDAPTAIAALREAARWYAACGDDVEQAACHASLSTLHRDELDDLPSALRHARTATRLADSTRDWKAMAQARLSWARAHLAAGDPWAGQPIAEQALTIVSANGDPVGEAWCLILTADVACAIGDLTGARDAATRAIELSRRTHRPDAEAAALTALARIDHAAGNLDTARHTANQALERHKHFSSPIERHHVERLIDQLSAGP